ncbi:MAG: carboxypeptidase regulatory-like domain-containing protein [Polyangiaceae bacterium]|nr:carboxypeptidase regulatory-like domain-containing protein [Polyangiaceae bacterium]
MARDWTDRRRAWLSAALLSAALLILPVIAWLLLPIPTPSAPPPRAVSTAAAATPPAEPEEPSEPPPPRPRAAATVAAAPTNQGGPVHGSVLDPSGKPIQGAFVTCKDRPAVGAGTDAEGRFELSEEADGCAAVATHAAHSPSEETRLSAGADNVLRLLAGGVIEGIVVSETGSPVEAYLLAVESFMPAGSDSKAGFSNRPRIIEDPGGAFRWDDLPPGRYVLTASSAGRPPARSNGIEVEAGRTSRGVRIVLPRGVTLMGKIIDADTRAPVKEAQVELDSVTTSGANAISLVLSDGAGDYELEGVPATGPFSVKVRHIDYVTKIVPGLDARGSSTLRADIEIRARGDGGANEELAGIGATLAPSPKGVMIIGVIDGGPAARGGLQQGDRIVRIDGADATDLPVSDCVQRLRGHEGTRVRVAVDREGQTIEANLVRAVVVR